MNRPLELAPKWLLADPFAKQLLEQGASLDLVDQVVERAAILEYDDHRDRAFAGAHALVQAVHASSERPTPRKQTR